MSGALPSDRSRLHGDLDRYRRHDSSRTDFLNVHSRDVAYLLRIADVVAQVAACEVRFGDKPPNFTCLDQLADAADMTSPYGESFRAEILNGDHMCSGCQLRAALAEF